MKKSEDVCVKLPSGEACNLRRSLRFVVFVTFCGETTKIIISHNPENPPDEKRLNSPASDFPPGDDNERRCGAARRGAARSGVAGPLFADPV